MYISKKAKWIIIGVGSTLACVGASFSGWAVISYYKENTKTPSEHLNIAMEMKIAPNVGEKMTKYSSEWMELYATDKDFIFEKVKGYDSSLTYEVISKKSLGNKDLEVEVEITNKNNESLKYTTKLTNIFATSEISAQTVIQETIVDLPSYSSSVDATKLPEPGTTVTPESIAINSPYFSKAESLGFIYNNNGAKLNALLTIDGNSTTEQVESFITKFKELGTMLTDEQLNSQIASNIVLGKTIILFEINDGLSETSSGTVMVKDFYNLDSSNFIENADELSVELNDPFIHPTAADVIQSINDNNSQKYLVFKDLPSIPKFNYKIISAETQQNDIKQESLIIKVLVWQSESVNTKTYETKLDGLLSVQQNELNNIIANNPYNEWAIKPTISPIYKNKTIKEIIESNNFEAFVFTKTLYPDFEYQVTMASEIVLLGKPAISVEIYIKSKINPEAKYSYTKDITKGFKPS